MYASKKCRCCLAENCNKDLNNTYTNGEKQENYGAMLSETFNLTLDCPAKLICEDCIEKLRDATKFKQRVIESETALIEQSRFIDDDNDDKELQIKMETQDTELLPKEEVNDDDDTCLDINDIEMCPKDIMKKDFKNKALHDKNISQSRPKRKLNASTINTLELIRNSNLCLFRPYHNNTEYACFLCKERYTNIKNLRDHSKTHKTEMYLNKIRSHRALSCRHVDISNLACKCSQTCDDLEALKKHLTEKHDKKFIDAGHILIPFKLCDGFKCIFCQKSFHTFYTLRSHMNSHATDNVCDMCGTAYYNREDLNKHVRAKHIASKCNICLSSFSTSSELGQHKRKVHNVSTTRQYRCKKCNEVFNYKYKLQDHMVSTHNVAETKQNCHICGKKLKNKQYLDIHILSVHMKQRRYQCSYCDLRFFTKHDQTRHERTHLSGSLFSCDCCETKFKSKDSLRRHTKKQHNRL